MIDLLYTFQSRWVVMHAFVYIRGTAHARNTVMSQIDIEDREHSLARMA